MALQGEFISKTRTYFIDNWQGKPVAILRILFASDPIYRTGCSPPGRNLERRAGRDRDDTDRAGPANRRASQPYEPDHQRQAFDHGRHGPKTGPLVQDRPAILDEPTGSI